MSAPMPGRGSVALPGAVGVANRLGLGPVRADFSPGALTRAGVAAMGGADTVVAQARTALAGGDPRWAAEILNHVVFDDRTHEAAKALAELAAEDLGRPLRLPERPSALTSADRDAATRTPGLAR